MCKYLLKHFVLNKFVQKINVYIFIFIRTNVDTSRQMLTLLSPQPKPLPETIYLMSDIQFMDSNS